jgi:hypothetical protein
MSVMKNRVLGWWDGTLSNAYAYADPDSNVPSTPPLLRTNSSVPVMSSSTLNCIEPVCNDPANPAV